MIVIKKLSKKFGRNKDCQQVVCDLSLLVKSHEVYGFIGPNGAGKSTTIKLLLGFIKAHAGTMTINGHTVGTEEYRYNVGYLPELPFFNLHLTALETLYLSGRLSGKNKSYVKDRAAYLLKKMKLSAAGDKKIGGFSKGMKQRLGMANALIHDPKVLILDEPMSGLDPLGRHLMKKLILSQKDAGKTIFFSTHILSDIEDLCDRIGLIHRGHLLYEGDIELFHKGDDIESSFVKIVNRWDQENSYGC
jgi:ABC-2 type transport system ATP-binding protein